MKILRENVATFEPRKWRSLLAKRWQHLSLKWQRIWPQMTVLVEPRNCKGYAPMMAKFEFRTEIIRQIKDSCGKQKRSLKLTNCGI